MKTKEEVKELLDYLQATEADLQLDEAAIVAAYQKESAYPAALAIKILSIFGGILASLAFMGFLFIAGLYNSETGMLLTGILSIAGALLLNKADDRIIIDTISVSAFIIGFALVGFGLSGLVANDNAISVVFILLAGCSLVFVQGYILSFVSVLIIAGSIMMLAIANNTYNLFPFYIAALAVVVTYVFVQEAKIIAKSKALSRLYHPLRVGLVFSFLSALVVAGHTGWIGVHLTYAWIPSAVIIAAILYVASIVFKNLGVTNATTKFIIYLISAAILLSTLFYPSIPGAMLVLLLSFLVNHKTGLVAGAAAFIYFVSQYYYDLNLTLLAKSVIMFSSGVLFIVLYLFTYKKLTDNEQV